MKNIINDVILNIVNITILKSYLKQLLFMKKKKGNWNTW